MWEVEYFEKENGRCPTSDFLDGLSPQDDLPYIENALKQLEEHGNKLRRPQVEYLQNDIYELRVKTRNGQFRLLYFFFTNNRIIITHGFQKKTNKVSLNEIKKAVEFRKIYFLRLG